MVSHSHSWLAPCPPAILWLAGLAAAGGAIAGAKGTTLDRLAGALDLGLSSASGSEPVGAFSSRRCRLGATCTPARAWATPAGGPDLGGAAAIGTTPSFPEALEPVIEGGDSEVFMRDPIELDGACWMEFLRDVFLDDREAPTASVFALLRFLFLMTSVFKDSGRTTP